MSYLGTQEILKPEEELNDNLCEQKNLPDYLLGFQ